MDYNCIEFEFHFEIEFQYGENCHIAMLYLLIY